MEGIVMTAVEAYGCDVVFRVLVDEWIRERRCPAPLVDRCLDLGMAGGADCARWGSDWRNELYPGDPDQGDYWWCDESRDSFSRDCFGGDMARLVPAGRIRGHLVDTRFHRMTRELYLGIAGDAETVLEAVLWLLDHWEPAGVVA